MLPQAYVSPAAMRATRDLLWRRIHLMRKRAELLTHVQQTNSQYNLPEIGKKMAYKTNRTGVAELFADPAVQKSIEVDLALIAFDDQLLRDLELAMVTTAKRHEANPLSLLQTVPGTKVGNAYLTRACSEAAILFLHNSPAGQKSLAR